MKELRKKGKKVKTGIETCTAEACLNVLCMRTSIFELLFVVNAIFHASSDTFTLKNSLNNHCVLTREDEIHKNTALITGYILSFVASNEAEDTVFTRCST
jgi:hypothetical protein